MRGDGRDDALRRRTASSCAATPRAGCASPGAARATGSGRSSPGSRPATAPGARRALQDAAPRGGADDLGAFRALDLRYALGGLPLHTSVRAYRERPLLVFRTAAEEASRSTAAGASPSLASPGRGCARRCASPAARPRARAATAISSRSSPSRPTATPTSAASSSCRTGRACCCPCSSPRRRARCCSRRSPASTSSSAACPPARPTRDAGVRIGWHGDLDEVPRGFATELALLAGRRAARAARGLGRAAPAARRHAPPRPLRRRPDRRALLLDRQRLGVLLPDRARAATTPRRSAAKLDELRAEQVPVHCAPARQLVLPARAAARR